MHNHRNSNVDILMSLGYLGPGFSLILSRGFRYYTYFAWLTALTCQPGEGPNQVSRVLSSPHLHGGNSRWKGPDVKDSRRELVLSGLLKVTEEDQGPELPTK